MESPSAERRIYTFFEISILLKGANAALEILGGLLALLIPPRFVQDMALYFTQEELGQDSHDFIATHLLHLAQQYAAGGKTFAAFYLLSHGIVKLGLVVGLLRNKLWAYPTSLIVFGLFIAYQIYLYTLNHSLTIAALTVFDLVVMWLIWREYGIVREHRAESTPAPQ